MSKGMKSRFSLRDEIKLIQNDWSMKFKSGNGKYKIKAFGRNHFVKIVISHYKMHLHYHEGIERELSKHMV